MAFFLQIAIISFRRNDLILHPINAPVAPAKGHAYGMRADRQLTASLPEMLFGFAPVAQLDRATDF